MGGRREGPRDRPTGLYRGKGINITFRDRPSNRLEKKGASDPKNTEVDSIFYSISLPSVTRGRTYISATKLVPRNSGTVRCLGAASGFALRRGSTSENLVSILPRERRDLISR